MEQLVAAAVIERNGALLLCRRPSHKRHGGLWEFPGGKHEPGESAEEALRRELKEELDLELSALGALLFSAKEQGSNFRVEFYPAIVSGEPKALEHEELRWVGAESLLELNLAPTDRAFAEQSARATA